MNKIHKTVWNQARKAFIVCSEASKSHGKDGKTSGNSASLPSKSVMTFARLKKLCGILALGTLSVHAIASTTCDSTISTATSACTASGDVTVTSTGSITYPTYVSGTRSALTVDSTSGTSHIGNDGTISSLNGAGNAILVLASMNGSITNTGTISSVSGNTIAIGDGYSDVYIGSLGSIGFYNSGTILTTIKADDYGTGYWYGVTAQHATINGDFINAGFISSTGHAIDLENSTINGNLTNTGTVNTTLADSFNAAIYSTGSAINGDVTNSGTLLGDVGIKLFSTTVSGSIVNTGYITNKYNGFFSYGSSAQGIYNYGTISATGGWLGSGTAIEVNGSTFGTLYNYGIIQGAGYSIYTGDASISTIYALGNQNALIGDVYANSTDYIIATNGSTTVQNAMNLQSLTIQPNAKLTIANETSSSGDLAEGITVSNGLSNGGTLEVLAGETATINGDYVQSSTGKLKTDVASNSSYGKLVVTGTATLASNTQIVVNVANPNYAFTANSLSAILSAGTLVSDGTFSVSDNSLLFDFTAVKNGNQVDLVLTAASSNNQVPSNPGNSSSTGNESVYKSVMNNNQTHAAGAAVVLDNLVSAYANTSTTGNTDMDTVVTNLGALSTAADVAAATAKTLPLLNGQAPTAIQTQLQTNQNVIAGRLDSTRGLSSGDSMLSSGNAWLKVYSTRSTQHDQDGVSGYLAQTTGGVLGIDGDVAGKDLTLGAAFGFNKAHVSQNNGLHTASIDNYQGVIYGSKKLASKYADFVDFQADLGYQTISGDRTIEFSDIHRVAHADYNGFSYHLGSSIGKNFQISERVKIQPVLGLDYTFVKSNGYTENGADALDLIVGSQKAKQLLYSAGTKWDVKMNDKTTFYGKVAVAYDQFAETDSILAAYAGDTSATFVTSGINPGHWVRTLSAGLKEEFSKGFSANIQFDLANRDSGASYSWSAKLNKTF